MRALKEEIVVLPSSLSVDADCYQSFCETALARLNEFEQRLIYLRFWQCLPIARIADIVGGTWNETDRKIDNAVVKIRATFRELKNKRPKKEVNFEFNSEPITCPITGGARHEEIK